MIERYGTNLIMALVASAGTFVGIGVMPPTFEIPQNLPEWLQVEVPTIIAAARRNNVTAPQDIKLMFAIRRAERGAKGREMGILHPKALQQCKDRPTETLSIQSGWLACTLRNHRLRHKGHNCGRDFVACLARRYAPINCGNDNGTNCFWERNVRYFLKGCG